MVSHGVILRQDGPGQFFIVGLQPRMVLAGLFKRRLHIGAADGTAAGDER